MDVLIHQRFHDAFAHGKTGLRVKKPPQQRFKEVIGDVLFPVAVGIVIVVVGVFIHRRVPGRRSHDIHIADFCSVFLRADDHIRIVDILVRDVVPGIGVHCQRVLLRVRQTRVERGDRVGVGDSALRIGAEIEVVTRVQQRFPGAFADDHFHPHHRADPVADVSVVRAGMRDPHAGFIDLACASGVEISAHRTQQPAGGLSVAEDFQPLRLCVVAAAERSRGVRGVAVRVEPGRGVGNLVPCRQEDLAFGRGRVIFVIPVAVLADGSVADKPVIVHLRI